VPSLSREQLYIQDKLYNSPRHVALKKNTNHKAFEVVLQQHFRCHNLQLYSDPPSANSIIRQIFKNKVLTNFEHLQPIDCEKLPFQSLNSTFFGDLVSFIDDDNIAYQQGQQILTDLPKSSCHNPRPPPPHTPLMVAMPVCIFVQCTLEILLRDIKLTGL
jgi:hypothetical protein